MGKIDINRLLELGQESLFSNKQPPLVGIDISASSIKLLELSQNNSQYRIESYATVPIPKDAIVNTEIKDVEAVSNAIKLVKKKSRTQAKLAAVAISGSSIVSKVIRMDAGLTPGEQENQAMLEASNYVPYPIEEVSLDFVVLGPTPKRDDSIDVLLVASRTENVASRADILEDSGLKAKVVDIDSYALGRSLLLMQDQIVEQGQNKTIGVIDIGKNMTVFGVLQDFAISYTHEEEFGGNNITEHLQTSLEVSAEDASFAKKHGYLPNDKEKKPKDEIYDICRDVVFNHIHHLLQFYVASGQKEVDQIILSGGTVAMPKLQEYLSEKLNIPVLIPNPFANMQFGLNVDKDELIRNASSMLVCCGLALRRFDS